jgi:hypothetical protein
MGLHLREQGGLGVLAPIISEELYSCVRRARGDGANCPIMIPLAQLAPGTAPDLLGHYDASKY